jgi:hypothetical protein
MYGSYLNFSSVTLPGVGGGLNASNAIGMDRLKEMNASGKKWSPDIAGGMSHHNEAILKGNAAQRDKRQNLVNRSYNEQCDGGNAMKEIFARKKARMASFKELKSKEYGFSEGDSQDSELLSMPMPSMGMGEHKCKGPGCPICSQMQHAEAKFREWDTAKRKELKEGEFKGDFAGPAMSFPISSPEDVSAAWSSVGRAKNPRAIMKNIISIAKRHGFESGLPDSVRQRLSAGESGLPG